MADIMLRVVPPAGQDGNLASSTLTERFEARVEELAASIGQIAQTLRGRLDVELGQHPGDGMWALEEVALRFSLDVEAEAGVVIAKAKTTAGFEVELTWHRQNS